METREKVLGVIAGAAGPLSLREIAASVGVSHVAVLYHLRRLERDGLVYRDYAGRLRLAGQ